MIDLNRYDRVVENGVVVYRSKFPIQVTNYTPTQLTVSPSSDMFTVNPTNRAATNHLRVSSESEDRRISH